MTGGPDADGRASLIAAAVAVVLCLLIHAIFSTIG